MKFCPSCGKELSPNSRFCTGCGYKLSAAANPIHREDYETPSPKKQKSKIGIMLALIGLLALGYYGLERNQNISADMDNSTELWEEATGTYYDRSGLLTGKKDGPIFVRFNNGKLMGHGEFGAFTFVLKAKGKNAFSGTVSLNNVEAQCSALYDPHLKKLTFSRAGSPLDWSIVK